MNKYERIVDIKDGVKIKLETREHKDKDWVYGTVIYDDGEMVPIGHVVAKAKDSRSYYYWTNETIYTRTDLGTISNVVFDIDKRDFKKIYISPTDRRYAFGNVYKGDNRSVTYDYEVKVNDETTLLIDRYWSGSDLCDSISVFYKSDNSVVNLKPVIVCTPADYEVPEYYLWDEDYVYICFDGNSEK